MEDETPTSIRNLTYRDYLVWSQTTKFKAISYMLCLPASALSALIDCLEEEVNRSRNILMGDVNFDYQTCTNNKWHNLIQPSDLTQIVTEPTRITPSSSIIIDHIYTTQLVIISLSASQGKLVVRYKKTSILQQLIDHLNLLMRLSFCTI